MEPSPGHTYILDVCYLNESQGYKNVLIFVCRTSSYVICIRIPSVTTDSVIKAIRHFLGIMPHPKNFKTDFGEEFSIKVSSALAQYNINHTGKLPNRSDQQASAEVSIKIVKSLLHKLCSMTTHGGRTSWVTLLPQVVQSINASHAYKSPLSRSTVFFSPYHYSNPGMILEDSFLLQGNTIDSLNMTRIRNLKN